MSASREITNLERSRNGRAASGLGEERAGRKSTAEFGSCAATATREFGHRYERHRLRGERRSGFRAARHARARGCGEGEAFSSSRARYTRNYSLSRNGATSISTPSCSRPDSESTGTYHRKYGLKPALPFADMLGGVSVKEWRAAEDPGRFHYRRTCARRRRLTHRGYDVLSNQFSRAGRRRIMSNYDVVSIRWASTPWAHAPTLPGS